MTESRTVDGLLLAALRARGEQPALRSPCQGGERDVVTARGLAEDVTVLAAAWRARGLEPGDRVLFVSENRAEWLAVDLSLLHAGLVTVPRGTTATPDEVATIRAHSGARAAVVEDRAALERYREALVGCDPIVVVEPDDALPEEVEPLSLLRADAADADSVAPVHTGADVATIVYTSGTTGRPKGVTLTHENVVSDVELLVPVLPVAPGDVFLALLPTWHMYERTVEYFALFRGGVLSHTDLRRLRADLRDERPHYLPSVPRVWEKLHDAVVAGVAGRSRPVRELLRWSLRGALRHARAARRARGRAAAVVGRGRGLGERIRGGLTRCALLPARVLADRLVFTRLREATGGRLRAAVSGGGALPPHVDEFFDAAGLTVLVGYGLTETSPVVAVRRPTRNVLGTIGTALERTELRLVDPESRQVLDGGTGVLEVRGPQVMRGYWDDAEATADVLDPEGWFHTGDLCSLTTAGDIVFRGRAKDTIVLTGGENLEPAPLEELVLASPWIEQAVVVGQDRKTPAVLVWPDATTVEAELGTAPDAATVLDRVRTEVRARTRDQRPWERLHRVVLLPEALSVENGLLTATMKVRRPAVALVHAELIDSAYA